MPPQSGNAARPHRHGLNIRSIRPGLNVPSGRTAHVAWWRRLETVVFLLAVAGAAALATGCSDDLHVATAELASGEVGRSTVALSADGGTAYYTWVARDSTGWNVWLSAWTRGASGPSAPVRVNATPGNAAAHNQAPPQVGVDAEGRVYVAWINRIDVPGRRFPANDLFLAVSGDGGRTFGPEQTVNSDAGGLPTGHTFHNMTPLPDGSMLVSWIDGRARAAAEAKIEATVVTTSGDAHSAHAAMHAPLNNDSDVPAVGSEIRVARVEDGGRIIRETAVLDQSSCPCCRTNLAVGPDGRIHAVWRHEYESGERDIVTAHSDDGGETFSPLRPVFRDHWNINACPHTGPAIAVDGDGRVHVVWYTGAESAPGIRHAVSADRGETFSKVSTVLDNVPVSQVALAASSGQVTLLTEDHERNGLSSWRVRGGNINWTSLQAGAELPSQAAAGGTLVQTWREGNALKARMWS